MLLVEPEMTQEEIYFVMIGGLVYVKQILASTALWPGPLLRENSAPFSVCENMKLKEPVVALQNKYHYIRHHWGKKR